MLLKIFNLLFNRKPYSVKLHRFFFESLLAAMGVPRGTAREAVSAGGVPAEWISPPEAAEGNTLFYLHGGGFLMGSIRSHRPFLARLCRAARARGLIIGYRRTPDHSFPHALDDALAAYRWALAQGIRRERLALVGDSAGGGLALSLMLSLKSGGEPLPAAGYLVSPWVDLARADRSPARTDWSGLVDLNIRYLAGMYTAGHDPLDPLISPVFGDLGGLPPLLIQAGRREPLYPDAISLERRAREAGVKIELVLYPGFMHTLPLLAPLSRAAVRLIGGAADFLRLVLPP